MPGHSYSGSSAAGHTAAVFPPTPVASFDGDLGFYNLTVSIAACTAGRPTFDGYCSFSNTGNPTSDPGLWTPTGNDGPFDTGTDYVQGFENDQIFFIGRARYGLNVSGWSNIASG